MTVALQSIDANTTAVLVNGNEVMRLVSGVGGRIKAVQVGDSATATHNFVLSTAGNGSGTLARGVHGAPSQNIISWDAAGGVTALGQPLRGPCFRATGTGQVFTANVTAKVTLGTEDFDTDACYDATFSRFQPTTAGYYQLHGIVTMNAASSALTAFLYKNGASERTGVAGSNTGSYLWSSAVSSVMFLNGSTDYVEMYASAGGGGLTTGFETSLCGVFIRP